MNTLTRTETFLRNHWRQTLIIFIPLTIFLLFTWLMRDFHGHDIDNFQIHWWNYISEQGFSGISTITSAGVGADYPSIWYFIIWIFTSTGIYPALPLAICIKLIAVIGTIISATIIFQIIKHFRPKTRYLPSIAFSLTLFLPSFFLDVAKTNLPDTIYICFSLGAILALLKRRWCTVWFLIGMAINLKFMAVFIVPFLLYFYLKDFLKMNWQKRLAPICGLLTIPLCAIPGLLAGSNFYEASVLSTIFHRSGFLTAYGYTPNIWQFVPENLAYHFIAVATIITAGVISTIMFFALALVPSEKKSKIEYPILMTLLPLAAFFFIPGQREAYFSIAGVTSALAFLISPRRETFLIALGINYALAMSYLNAFWDGNLFGTTIVADLYLLVLLLGSIITYLLWRLFKHSKCTKS